MKTKKDSAAKSKPRKTPSAKSRKPSERTSANSPELGDVPCPPAKWNPRWTAIRPAKAALATRPTGTVFAYRAGRFRSSPHCFVFKVAAGKWLAVSGIDEAEALAEWRQLAARPPQRDEYMSDAETRSCLRLAPASVRLAAEVVQ